MSRAPGASVRAVRPEPQPVPARRPRSRPAEKASTGWRLLWRAGSPLPATRDPPAEEELGRRDREGEAAGEAGAYPPQGV